MTHALGPRCLPPAPAAPLAAFLAAPASPRAAAEGIPVLSPAPTAAKDRRPVNYLGISELNNRAKQTEVIIMACCEKKT